MSWRTSMNDGRERTRRPVITAICLVLVLVSLLVVIQLSFNDIVQHAISLKAMPWSDIEPLEEVALRLEETKHYQMFTPEGIQETQNLLPSGYTRTINDRTYTIAMFHQLECLRIIRRDLKAPLQSDDAKNCMNYLRQSVLCRADTQLEAVFIPSNMSSGALAVLPKDYRCRDWTQLYDSAA